MQDQKFTLPYPPLQVRAGVLVADGYGISLRVLYGKLHIEDGIGPHRRSIVLDRAGSGLERLVLLGKSGTITLEALAWLRAIGATLVQLDPSGEVLAHSVPYGYDGQPIRRAQALAVATGLDVEVARDLIARKLTGQRANLSRLRGNLQGFDALREALEHADSIEQVRVYEGQAAAIYWNAWSSVPIRLRNRDLARVPARWARYDSRASILTGAPRAATNPVNALLNYIYALLESEARLALLAAGLDPTLGVLHSDQRNRDSFALDAMEPVRPDVDAFLLDLLEDRTFTSRDFVELSNGVCRVAAPLTHELALTLPHWRECLRPIVADLAQTFRDALSNRSVEPCVRSARVPGRRTKPGPLASPLSHTPRKTSQPRPYAAKLWGVPHAEGLAGNPIPCALCGKPVLKRRRRHCDECIPKARREHGLRAIEAARKALAAQTASGNDPRRSPEINRKRGAAIAEQGRRNRRWKREHPNGAARDRAWFLREITPRLDDMPLAVLARVTGLSLAGCSRYRIGSRVPHPRHWDALLALVEAATPS
jgi:CRISPR-associated endonuclease Cas1